MKRVLASSLTISMALSMPLVATNAWAGYQGRTQTYQRTTRLQQGLRLLRNASVASGLVVGALTTGYVYHQEAARPNLIPLAFSELSQIKRDLAAKGEPMSPATAYLASNSESKMKVFEAWNLAHSELALGSEAEKFAYQLNIKMTQDPHSNKLPALLDGLPDGARTLRLALSPMVEVTQGVRPAASNFGAAWRYDRQEHWHTETRCCRTVTVGSGKDATTRQETYTEDVYDNTTHTYTYDRGAGEAASAGLDALRTRVPSLGQMPVLQTASKTNAEGDFTQDVSFGRSVKNAFSKAEHQQVANTWARGSTYNSNLGAATQDWNDVLRRSADAWRSAKGGARSVSYTIYPKYDPSPPQAYLVAEKAEADARAFLSAAEPILNALDHGEMAAPVLKVKVQQLIQSAVEKKGVGDPAKLTKEIMELARKDYEMNFSNGIDTKAFRGYVVAIAGLVGTLGGAGLGFAGQRGVNYLRRRTVQPSR